MLQQDPQQEQQEEQQQEPQQEQGQGLRQEQQREQSGSLHQLAEDEKEYADITAELEQRPCCSHFTADKVVARDGMKVGPGAGPSCYC